MTFNKPPEWGKRFDFPENVQIEYNGVTGSVTSEIAIKMAERYDDAVVEQIAMEAKLVGVASCTVLNRAAILDALNKQTPKKPTHVYEVYPKHDWMQKDNGEIDMLAFSVGYCNGPMCRRCYHTECEHCNPR